MTEKDNNEKKRTWKTIEEGGIKKTIITDADRVPAPGGGYIEAVQLPPCTPFFCAGCKSVSIFLGTNFCPVCGLPVKLDSEFVRANFTE